MSTIDASFRVGNDCDESDCIIEAYGGVEDADSERFRDVLDAGLGELPDHLIVDLAGVTSISRVALSVLAAAERRGQSLGTNVTLRSPSRATVRQIDEAGLSDLLQSSNWARGTSQSDHLFEVSRAPFGFLGGWGGAPAFPARRCMGWALLGPGIRDRITGSGRPIVDVKCEIG